MGDFLLDTRQGRRTLPAVNFVSGGQSTFDLPQTGFGVSLNLKLKGTATAGAGGGATMATYPYTPWSLIKRLRIFSNEGVELYNTSGIGNYLWQKTWRTAVDPAANPQSFLGGFTDPFGQYFAQTGNILANGSASFRAYLRHMFTWGENWQGGLILLQNTAVRYTVEITWGTVTDLFSAGSGNITLSGVTVTPTLEFAHLPSNPKNFPVLQYVNQVIEQSQSVLATGDFTYLPPTGNLYYRLISEFSNNGVPNLPSDITNLKMDYSQTQVPYNEEADNRLFDMRRFYAQDFPSGCWVWELAGGNGFPEVPTSRDIINTARLTDFEVVSTVASGVAINNMNARFIRGQLLPIRVSQ